MVVMAVQNWKLLNQSERKVYRNRIDDLINKYFTNLRHRDTQDIDLDNLDDFYDYILTHYTVDFTGGNLPVLGRPNTNLKMKQAAHMVLSHGISKTQALREVGLETSNIDSRHSNKPIWNTYMQQIAKQLGMEVDAVLAELKIRDKTLLSETQLLKFLDITGRLYLKAEEQITKRDALVLGTNSSRLKNLYQIIDEGNKALEDHTLKLTTQHDTSSTI